MVSVDKISEKLMKLDEFLSLLQELSARPLETFLNDKILIGSAKYYLQVSIECCLDIANHIIAAERFRAPKDYADTFKVLQEAKLIPVGLGNKLQQMAKFRNRLVHLYGEIDDAFVHDFITGDVDDIVVFRSIIIDKYIR